MPVPFVSGWQRITSSGIVGVSAAPIWVSGYTFESGGTAAVPYFLDGSTGSGTLAWRGGGGVANAGSGQQVVGQLPVTLVHGLYISFDANTTAVTVYYVQA